MRASEELAPCFLEKHRYRCPPSLAESYRSGRYGRLRGPPANGIQGALRRYGGLRSVLKSVEPDRSVAKRGKEMTAKYIGTAEYEADEEATDDDI